MEKLIMATMMIGALTVSILTVNELGKTHDVVQKMVASIVVVK